MRAHGTSASFFLWCNAISITAGAVGVTFAGQAVLRASGIGRESPAAAALLSPAAGLITKDAIGQFAAFICMRYVSARFDRNLWFWRVVAALLEALGTMCDAATPFVGPNAFVALTAVSSLSKSIACTAASATKVVCCQILSQPEGRLGSLSADLTSQTSMAYMAGTVIAFAIALLDAKESERSTWHDIRTLLMVACSSIVHIGAVLVSTNAVVIHQNGLACMGPVHDVLPARVGRQP